MEETVRWSLTVSRETDRDLRAGLGKLARRGDALSRFVEHAVRKELFALAVAKLRARNAGSKPREIEREIELAIAAVRAQGMRKPHGRRA